MEEKPFSSSQPATTPADSISSAPIQADSDAAVESASLPESEGEMAEPSREETLNASRNGGASWFYWIAGLSLVNAVMVAFGSDYSFPLGLGSSLVVDVVAKQIGGVARVIGAGLDFIIIGFFVWMGWLSHRGKSWAFVLGGIFYALDALLMIVFQEWLGIALHVWALISIWSGFRANNELNVLRKQAAQNANTPWA